MRTRLQALAEGPTSCQCVSVDPPPTCARYSDRMFLTPELTEGQVILRLVGDCRTSLGTIQRQLLSSVLTSALALFTLVSEHSRTVPSQGSSSAFPLRSHVLLSTYSIDCCVCLRPTRSTVPLPPLSCLRCAVSPAAPYAVCVAMKALGYFSLNAAFLPPVSCAMLLWFHRRFAMSRRCGWMARSSLS